jgi:LmbE family N-acetylglucosaminyl deacetylase
VKVRIYFRPALVVASLVLATTTLFAMASLLSSFRWLWWTGAGFYSLLSLASCYALWRIVNCEQWIEWATAERLLILAPHQDDCVICAGGTGLRNQQLGGETYVVYLVQEPPEDRAFLRKEEAKRAWCVAGVSPDHLQHLNLLPELHARDPQLLDRAAKALDEIITTIAPTVIMLPAFEGGHIHHDVLNHLVTGVVSVPAGVRIYECPEYTPYVSLRLTPHKIIALCGRWIAGLLSYYGPPDGIDRRIILKVRLTADELMTKRRMLAAFRTQHPESLERTRCYPDRFVAWQRRPFRSQPFRVRGSYPAFVRSLERILPVRLVHLLLPGQTSTYGREPGFTELSTEGFES